LLPELKEIAKELNIKKSETLKKQDLIYKILDQQAIDATELKPVNPAEDGELSSSEQAKQDAEALLRRGKRPRTRKPVIKRTTESVMSVSPDDLTQRGQLQTGRNEPGKK
jgi:transcription termination factor Rho